MNQSAFAPCLDLPKGLNLTCCTCSCLHCFLAPYGAELSMSSKAWIGSIALEASTEALENILSFRKCGLCVARICASKRSSGTK